MLGSTGFAFEGDTVIEYMRRGVIDVKPLITHVYPLDKVQQAFDVAGDPDVKSIKVMLTVGGND
jgi:threonine dehydrogenase-like Zn-dependent dehydrogenase